MTRPAGNDPHKPYQSYLIRLWLEDACNPSSWRIALINTQTGSRRGFNDFGRLVAFLKEEWSGEPKEEERKKNHEITSK